MTNTELHITKEMRIWLIASAVGLLIALIITMHIRAYSEEIQAEIAGNVLRFHVVAASDSAADQALKYLVRDELLAEFSPILATKTLDEAREFLQANLGAIQKTAADTLAAAGHENSVKVLLGQALFPLRLYNDIAFPSGEYEALRVIIGSGSGSNWWCVMFPPLCYVDAAVGSTENCDSSGVSPENNVQIVTLSHVLSEDTYSLMRHENDTEARIRFKIVEWWQSR